MTGISRAANTLYTVGLCATIACKGFTLLPAEKISHFFFQLLFPDILLFGADLEGTQFNFIS